MKFFSDLKKTTKEKTSSVKESVTDAGRKGSDYFKKRAMPLLFGALTVLVLVLAAALILGAGTEKDYSTDPQHLMARARSKEVVKCGIESINTFFEDYYFAQSEGNTTDMEAMYDHPEKTKITAQLSTIIESYSDIEVYVTPGIRQGEVVCFVYNSIHFNNIDTPAPSVDSFYIYMDAENNRVQILTSMYTDEAVRNYMKLISYRNPIRSLLTSVQDGLYGALESNTDLRNLYVVMSSMTNNVIDNN